VRRIARRHDVPLVLLTLTAPGAPKHKRPDPASADPLAPAWIDCDCSAAMCAPEALAHWNAALGHRWARFLADGLRRDPATGKRATPDRPGAFAWALPVVNEAGLLVPSYLKAVEAQRRGALHVHALLQVVDGFTLPTCVPGCEAPRCPLCALARSADPRVVALSALAERYGFGHVLDVQVISSRRAAGYVAKYVAKGANDRPDVPWMREHAGGEARHRHPDEVSRAPLGLLRGRATYRTWSASRSWPNTMRALRLAQQHFAAVLSVLPSWEDGEHLGADLADLCPDRPACGPRPRSGNRGLSDDPPAPDPADLAVWKVLDARAALSLPSALRALESVLGPVEGVTAWEALTARRAFGLPVT
jgi:hypothetical protein